MKRTSINTQKKCKCEPVSNGFSFPAYTASTNPVYHSTSTYNILLNEQKKVEKTNMYSLCADWVEIICKSENPIELDYINFTNSNIIVEKISVHNNPNFRNLHRIHVDDQEVCEIFSTANNSKHGRNEVSVKISNSLLYTANWVNYLRKIVNSFHLEFIRMARLDIALDGQDLMKLDNVLNKYTKSHTIQINNDAIKILPFGFDKITHRWSGWSIGKQKSGISARFYNKSVEIISSGKGYAESFWQKNGISTEMVGRFEVQFNYTRLKKYRIDLTNMELLTNAEYLGTLFQNELQSWIRFYRVRRKDVLNHKKETAVKRGREIPFIKWNQLPNRIELLEFNNHVPNPSIFNARSNISFNLREILKHPNISTTAQVDVIEHYAEKYHLDDYVHRKIRALYQTEIRSSYVEFLKRYIDSNSNKGVISI